MTGTDRSRCGTADPAGAPGPRSRPDGRGSGPKIEIADAIPSTATDEVDVPLLEVQYR
ncbi:hypothetical protein [Pseudonocardia broussonetiae]|uniref:Uncharacterized protein n=1 Tax=Pseudonocardia broussonetiae TaxID=2736640 RepID=A0A6M6JNV4_9PSEU|nr:hypothetical protein [Pseudonocardia broussonetiae]QJY49618.1 hypothetical protein HOP40_30860 [Pseudonocardia broussonetiae]